MSARPWINYTEAGYDPTDGLTAGRWMRDTWGVVVWVQIAPPPPKYQCVDCPNATGPRAPRCTRCLKRRQYAAKLAKKAAA